MDQTLQEVPVQSAKKSSKTIIIIGVLSILACAVIAMLIYNASTGNKLFRDKSWQLTWTPDVVQQSYHENLYFASDVPTYPKHAATLNTSDTQYTFK